MSVVFGWALALALTIALPLWWHRRRQQSLNHTVFAAAQFLPSAQATQRRVWQWQQHFLLALRIAILLLLTALLSDFSVPFRAQTSLASSARWQADPALHDATIFCASEAPHCNIVSRDLWLWLAEHEREWPAGSALTIHAYADELAMPAQRPDYAHTVQFDFTARDIDREPLIIALVADEKNSRAIQRESSASSIYARFLMDKAKPVDLALYSEADNVQSTIKANQHVVLTNKLNTGEQFKLQNSEWSYTEQNGQRFYQHKRPTNTNEWRDLFYGLEQLKTKGIQTPPPSETLSAQLAAARLWPSDSLRNFLLLLLLIALISERLLHHAIHRSR